MTLRTLVSFVALVILLSGVGVSAVLAAQAPPPSPAPPGLPAPAAPDAPDPDVVDADDVGGRDIVRIGQDFILNEGEEAGSVVVVMGNAEINGRARKVVVVMGSLRLGRSSRVARELVSVAGHVTVADGADVGREMVVIAGTVDAPVTFNPGREQVIINPPFLGARLDSVIPYVTRGLFWGRVIVPGLLWVWGIVALAFVIYLVVNLVAAGAVRMTADLLQERTLTSFGTGLLVLLLTGPVWVLLTVSVVGLLVIPVTVCALLAAALVGKTAAFRWLGLRIWSRGDSLLQSTVTLTSGFALVTLLYMVPVIGIVVFALLSVLGLGASTLAFIAAFRREQPPAPPAPLAPTPPPVVRPPSPPPPLEPSAAADGATSSAVSNQAPPVAAPRTDELTAFPKGGFGDRLAAFVLDIILVVLVVHAVWPFRDGPRVLFLGLLAYHVGFWAWRQTTVGGLICQLRIVRVDGVPLTVADAFIRGLSAIFSLIVCGLGFLWVLRDPERQSWHDKIAGTYVVKVPRGWRQ